MLRTTLLASLSLSAALKLPAVQADRRSALAAAATAVFSIPAAPALALKPCPNGANNCWSTAGPSKNQLAKWSFPKGDDKAKATEALMAVLQAYPQEGQAGVDLGGWRLAEDTLSASGYARFEYKSGIGNFAKFFNGGKPFVDDLEVAVEDGFVCVRSSSRVGDSDFGVNAKRINYIAAGLRAKGWDAAGVEV